MLPILKHLNDLKNKAVDENKKRHDEYKKFESYYNGDYKGGNNQLNIIKGIIDTKTTLVLDFEAVSSVVPKTKSMANIDQVKLMNKIADILNDCNTHVLKINNFDTVKRETVDNFNKYGIGIIQTNWKQQDEEELGDVEITSVSPLDYYPDTTAKKVNDCNYIFKREVISTITLKKDYPQYADKIEKAKGVEQKDKTSNKQEIGAINTVATEIMLLKCMQTAKVQATTQFHNQKMLSFGIAT